MAVIAVFWATASSSCLKSDAAPHVTGYFLSVAVASWVSVVLASAAASVELAVSGTVPLRIALPAMVSVHMIIGIGEALITTAVVGAVLVARPDLVKSFDLPCQPAPPAAAVRPGGAVAANVPFVGLRGGALVVALALAVFVSPFASARPTVWRRVAVDKGFEAAAAEQPVWRFSPLPDYPFPGSRTRGGHRRRRRCRHARCCSPWCCILGRPHRPSHGGAAARRWRLRRTASRHRGELSSSFGPVTAGLS